MPGRDGTGPRGQGPMTGGAEGFCILKIPGTSDQPATGFAGRSGTYVVQLCGSVRCIECATQGIKRRIALLEKAQTPHFGCDRKALHAEDAFPEYLTSAFKGLMEQLMESETHTKE